MSDIPEGIVEPEVGAELNDREKALRDKFVKEYLTDYNERNAAIRVGYGTAFAREMSIRLMNCPYVAQQIKKLQVEEEEETAEIARKRVIAGLTREANYFGPGSSHSGRVAALAKLAAIHGLDAPTRTKTEITGADGAPLGAGMFVVPGICSVEEWEKAAAAQQEALVNGTTSTPQETKTE